MRYVDRHQNDPRFPLTANDVSQMLARTNGDLLRNKGALNVSVIDALIDDDDDLDATLDILVHEPESEASDFVNMYLNEGRHGNALVRRLCTRWPAVLEVLARSERLSEKQRRVYLNEALGSLSTELEYEVSETAAVVLRDIADDLPVLSIALSDEGSGVLASVLKRADVKLASLGHVSQPLRRILGRHGTFRITRENLQALAPDSTSIGLDDLIDADKPLAEYVLTDVEAYGSALSTEPVVYSVEDVDRLVEVVDFVAESSPTALDVILAHAPTDALVGDLTETPEMAWPALARAHRFVLSIANMRAYIDAVGEIDEQPPADRPVRRVRGRASRSA